MGSQEVIKIENDFILIRFQNDGAENYFAKNMLIKDLYNFILE